MIGLQIEFTWVGGREFTSYLNLSQTFNFVVPLFWLFLILNCICFASNVSLSLSSFAAQVNANPVSFWSITRIVVALFLGFLFFQVAVHVHILQIGTCLIVCESVWGLLRSLGVLLDGLCRSFEGGGTHREVKVNCIVSTSSRRLQIPCTPINLNTRNLFSKSLFVLGCCNWHGHSFLRKSDLGSCA